MPRKKAPQSYINLERERFSSFVVDLRQPVNKLKREAWKEEKKIGEQIKTEWREFSQAAREIRPNLLFKKSRLFNWRLDFSRWGRVLRTPFSGHFRSTRRAKKRSPWQEFAAVREREFQSALQYATGRTRRRTAAKEFLPVKEAAAPLPVAWYRPLLSFVLVLILIIIPFKLLAYFQVWDFAAWEAGIRQRSEEAVGNLLAAADAVAKQDFQEADSNFRAAGANFLAAQTELNRLSDGLLLLAGFSSDPKIKLAAESKKFLAAGTLASSLGRNLVLATDSLFNNAEEDFSIRLDGFLEYGAAAVSDARALEKTVSGIKSANLPAVYRARFKAVSEQAGSLAGNLSDFVGAGGKLKSILGLTRDKRYLVVFQNNAELRASGGFLGSYALVDIRDGRIRNLEVPAGGSYDTEAGRSVLVTAPEPLWLVDPLWHFWDANWWPDWPTTAKNLMWFYEKSGGPSVDGVISVTPTVVESLLQVTGPIDMTEQYGLVIDAENFWETVEKVVERDNLAVTHPEAVAGLPEKTAPIVSDLPLKQDLESNPDNKPKKIIGDLLIRIMEVLPQKLDRENMLKIITLFEENMAAKQILVYFTDPVLQAEASIRNWSGEIRPSNGDYLMIVNTNIAGQKSDRLMRETIEQTTEISPAGVITNTVKISRTHTGLKNEPLTGVRNVDWLRIYTPAGSELIFAEGFRRPDDVYLQDRPEPGWESRPQVAAENAAAIDPASGTKIYEENGKAVFANWLMVDPGETGVVILKYRLAANFFKPLSEQNWRERLNSWLNPADRETLPYSLLAQKQPGAAPSGLISRLVLPPGWEIFWRHPENMSGRDGWEISTPLDSDKYWSVLVKKNN